MENLFKIITVVLLFKTVPVSADLLFVGKVMGPIANIYSVDESGTLNKITDNILWRDMEADIAADGKIAFMSNREEDTRINMRRKGENFNIFITDIEGKNIVQITNTSGQELTPKFSPDNKRLAYLRDLDHKRELCIISMEDKSERIIVSADTIYGYSWSPDGKQLSYAAVNNKQSSLMIIDLDSKKTKVLLETSRAATNTDGEQNDTQLQEIVSPQWSPDGNKIAFIVHPLLRGAERQLKIYDIETKSVRLISNKGAQVQDSLAWSDNSKSILYSALINYKFYYDEKIHKKVYEGGMHIFHSQLDGKTTQITTGDHLFKKPVFSPDEKRIGFLYADALSDRTLQLKTMNLDSSGKKTLHNSVAQNSSLVWY